MQGNFYALFHAFLQAVMDNKSIALIMESHSIQGLTDFQSITMRLFKLKSLKSSKDCTIERILYNPFRVS